MQSDIMGEARNFIALGAIALCLCAGVGACGRKVNPYITTCQVGDDQLGTFQGRWTKVPVPIAFHVNSNTGVSDFSAAEIQAILGAVSNWNAFASASLNFQALDPGGSDPGSVRLSRQSKPADIRQLGIFSTASNAFTGAVVIYKDTGWPYSSSPQAIAITSVAQTGSSAIPNLSSAIIEVNYQNFFQSGLPQPDLESALAHEFGHLMGLKHSCESVGATGVPSCSDPKIDHNYLTALMYPAFSFARDGSGEIRRDLEANDQGRTNCLYEDLKQ